jgi:hypothetical protein
MEAISIFRRSIILFSVILFAQAASAALVDISAHFPQAVYIGQYDQLPGESQVATFSILEPGTVTITAEWSTWYPEIGFGRYGIVWKSPNDTWTDIPPFGEPISRVYTSNGRKIEQMDDAKDAPLKAVITYRVYKERLPLDKFQVSMQRPAYYEGSFSQKSQDSHMIMDFRPEAEANSNSGSITGTGTIVGAWNWFTGTKVYMHIDGTFEAWAGSQKSNTGTWTRSGNSYTFYWVDGGYVDTLTLSPDGQSLDGYNKGGTHVTGNKISSSDTVAGTSSISATGTIVGTWNWFTGTKVYIHVDGTFEAWAGSQKSNTGTWSRSGNKYTFYWVDGGYVDTLTLSPDGQSLDGYNKGGTHVTGNKISSSDTSTVTSTIVGTWNWFTGTKIYIHIDGTLEGWDGSKKINTGTWSRSGNKYTLYWVDGGYVDTLTLSPDGQSLDGYNKGGTHVTGNKISSSDTI